MKNFKKKVAIFAAAIFFPAKNFAKTPEKINLIFPDRTISLDFRAQKNLLQRAPRHFFKIKEKKFSVNFLENILLEKNLPNLKTNFVTKISPQNLRKFLAESAILRDEKNLEVKISIDENGKIIFDGQPRDGFKIDEKKLIGLLNSAILHEKKNVRVPAEKIFSKISVDEKLRSRGIREIIAIGESNFAGSSAARKKNILAAAAKFSGQILKKGEIFSFNKILGSVEKKDGFVPEFVIKGKKTLKEMGGGTCQVSTTVFRAAFSGGFPILTRRPHSYAVPYYLPHGLDATIYLGGQDFKFKNDSPAEILIQAFADGENLFFVFYGTRDDRKISFEGPFLSNYRDPPPPIFLDTDKLPAGETRIFSQSHDGFSAQWKRVVEKSGEKKVEIFRSNYQPWAAQIFRGTKKIADENLKNLEKISEKNLKTAEKNFSGSGATAE